MYTVANSNQKPRVALTGRLFLPIYSVSPPINDSNPYHLYISVAAVEAQSLLFVFGTARNQLVTDRGTLDISGF